MARRTIIKKKKRSEEMEGILARLRAGGDLRTRKVRRLRAAVRCGRYENDLKLAIAAERLLGEIAR